MRKAMHHGAYVKNLAAAFDKYPNLQSKKIKELLRDLNVIPADIRAAVRNNGDGHAITACFRR
jgi:superoxide dismutase, Fe-Mn family